MTFFDFAIVERWANFSGDYNPIHFELEAAAKIGAERLIVHGMLVLLPVKQALASAAPAQGGWMRVQSAFRQPVLQDVPVTIDIREAGAKKRYTVTSEDGVCLHFQGTLSFQAPPPEIVPDGTGLFEAAAVVKAWAGFTDSFPGPHQGWVFLDALLFSQFIRHHAWPLVGKILGLEQSLAEGFWDASVAVVQTSQSLYFDSEALDLVDFQCSAGIEYRYALDEWQKDGSRTFGKVCVEAWMGGRRLLHSELGLMLTRLQGGH